MSISPDQFEFSFSEGSVKPDGAAAWRAEWARRAEELCQRLGVPLNHLVEVRLLRGPVLQGDFISLKNNSDPTGIGIDSFYESIKSLFA